MSPGRVLEHFDRISEAPDAIPRLRRFILDLAVRGKLVEQDANDEPASELLKRIQVRRGRPAKSSIAALAADLPFELRPGWQPARIDQILAELQTGPFGSSLHQSDYLKGGTPVVNPASIRDGGLVPIDSMAVGRATLDRLATFRVRKGDVVMARRGEMGRCAVVTEREHGWLCGTGSLILRLPEGIFARFLAMLIGAPLVREYLGASAVGTTMQNLNQSILLRMVIGLPPLAEQHRIVAKIDELMALCDRLEAAQTERETRRDRLVAASLNRLNEPAADADGAESFSDHARFHLRHLPRLTTRPEHIQQLRQTILNLAVRGQLVPQDPNNELAPGFGIDEGTADVDRLELRLPSGWSWARVEDVAEARLGKMLDKAKNSGQPYRYLRNTNVHWFDIRMDELKTLRIEKVESEKYLLRDGDVLICEGGHGIGRTAVWRSTEADIAFQKALHRVRPGAALLSDFFAYCVYVYFHAGVLATYFTGVGIPHFTGKALSTLVFPLPPLAEQHRIVATVDELMALCDRLEAQLTTTQTETSRLLEAVLHQALTPVA